jgi:hypothetical protein
MKRLKIKPNKQYPSALPGEKAQSMVLIVISFLALLAIVGLVTDVGSLYLSWTELKRSVDAAAVAAANNMRTSDETITDTIRRSNMLEAARETLALNDIQNITDIKVLNCEDVGSIVGPNDLKNMCSKDIASKRKLAYVEASQSVPVYFLSLFGVQSITLHEGSVGEAAVLELVLVFDTSESMGAQTTGFDEYNFDPADCNGNNSCKPLLDAKNAAKKLINRLYDGYDRVSIVTFDTKGAMRLSLEPDLNVVKDSIDADIDLHDDAPLGKFAWADIYCTDCSGKYNPVFPEDRDGDGRDADAGDCEPYDDPLGNAFLVDKATYLDAFNAGLFNDNSNYGAYMCDDDNVLDVFNWNWDSEAALGWEKLNFLDYQAWPTGRGDIATVSTCIGCGIRLATDELASNGRPGGVWVMVVLTDGVVNMSDTSDTWPQTGKVGIPAGLSFGFCAQGFWNDFCRDLVPGPRYCIDSSSATCPKGTTPVNASDGYYSVLDYAMDRVDDAGLLYPDAISGKVTEPTGEDIVLYAITFGEDASGTRDERSLQRGVPLSHYIADVGDDGERGGPCSELDAKQPPGYKGQRYAPYQEQCGNYYYASNKAMLDRAFEDIAARIFTKISR